MRRAYLSLGSNMGVREDYIEAALQRIAETDGVKLLRFSTIEETDPVGYTNQPKFLNTVAEIETSLQPKELLHRMQAIENSLGRVRTVRFGPRTIDIDVLLFEDEAGGYIVSDDPELTLPHPRMGERAFVLNPLMRLCGDSVLGYGLRR